MPNPAREEQRLEAGRELVRSVVAEAAAAAGAGAASSPQEARDIAKAAISELLERKAAELEAAAKRFALLQRLEFVVGALALVQIALFMLMGEGRPVALVFTIAATLALYLVAAILDSRAKHRREEIQAQIQAAKKAKLKTADDGSLLVGFS